MTITSDRSTDTHTDDGLPPGSPVPAPIARKQHGHDVPEAVRQQNMLIAVAAHDMKNQLGVIRGTAQLIERHMRRAQAPEPERILSGLATIQTGTRKLQRLMEAFMDVARVQSGEPVEFNRRPTNLVALTRGCVQEYAQTTSHELTLSTTGESLIGLWDATRLERVVENLLSNAIKYSAPATAIQITIAQEPADAGDVAVLRVEDQGVGIPAADLPHIFQPFYRGSNVAQQTSGTGIGLFGARALVEQQGGTLRLESTAGVGTTLTLRLPLAG